MLPHSDITPQEREFLSCFKYTPNRAYLHCDEELMPKRRKVWASWNYLHYRYFKERERNRAMTIIIQAAVVVVVPRVVDLIFPLLSL